MGLDRRREGRLLQVFDTAEESTGAILPEEDASCRRFMGGFGNAVVTLP